MYHSKYKHKHADRRARLFPKKVESIHKRLDDKPRQSLDDYFNQRASQQSGLAGMASQQNQFAQQQQMASQNQYGGIASLLGGGIFGR